MRSNIVHCYTIRYKLKTLKGNASVKLISQGFEIAIMSVNNRLGISRNPAKQAKTVKKKVAHPSGTNLQQGGGVASQTSKPTL